MNQWTLLAEVAHSLTMTGYGLDVCVLWSEDPRSVRKPMETWQTVFLHVCGVLPSELYVYKKKSSYEKNTKCGRTY